MLDGLLGVLLLQRARQKFARQVVPRLGQGDGKAPHGPPVQLRGPAGAGTRSTGESPELHLQKPRLGEPVQVERGQPAGHPRRRGGLLAPDRTVMLANEVVQSATRRLLEERDELDVVGFHGPILTLTAMSY